MSSLHRAQFVRSISALAAGAALATPHRARAAAPTVLNIAFAYTVRRR